MKLWHAFAALFLIGVILAGCAPKIVKECPGGRFGSPLCRCRSVDTGRYVKCPPPR